MKKLIAIVLAIALPGMGLAQNGSEIVEKSFPLKAEQKVVLNLKFADQITIKTSDKAELRVKADILINDGKLNAAHVMDVDDSGNALRITTDFNQKMLKESATGDCNCNGSKQFSNNNGNKGYSVCSTINYTIYLPSNTVLEVETISGNIEIAARMGETEAKSISGFVDMSASGNQKADLFLKTISGEVYSNLDIAFLNRKENPIVGYELKGKLNGGGKVLRLESISGDVYLRKGE